MTTATYVAPLPSAPVMPPPTTLARLDIDAVTRDAFAANNAALDGYLRQIAPLPAWRNGLDCTIDAEPRGVAAPHESHERSRRYIWTLAAIVALSIVATGGLAFTAYQVGALPNVGLTVAIWIGAGGMLAIYLVQRLQAHDLAHSPEAIALVRERANAYATETNADAQAGLIAAYADTLRSQAAAHAATVQAQAAALDAHTQSLARPVPVRPPRRVTVAGATQPQAWELDAAGNPVVLPPPAPPCTPPSPPAAFLEYTVAAAPAPAGVDPTVAVMLAWVAELYATDAATGEYVNLEGGTRAILLRAPWSERSTALPPAARKQVWRRLQALQPPLFSQTTGGRYVLGPYPKLAALAAVRGALT